ncbi:MAG: hypothetical protein DRG78_07460 [Epsilonproteobacteria bacterium]|nr:MAG: hypothetical protein DRG78_07460 [Campylobacterota bacterium]
MWTTLLTNKYMWAGIIIFALTAYYEIKVFTIEVSYNTKVKEYNELEALYKKALVSLEDSITVSNNNTITMKKVISAYEKSNILNSKSISSKNKEIDSLLYTIGELRKKPKIIYPKEGTVVESGVVYITEIGDSNENSISNIGI